MDATVRIRVAVLLQTSPSTENKTIGPCADLSAEPGLWTPFSFSQWTQAPFSEDAGSKIADPHFVFPYFPIDDFSLRSSGAVNGFVPLDADQAGRTFRGERMEAPPIAPTFLTAPLNAWTDF